MASEICNLFHLWILPDAELVIDETVRGEDLSVEGVPLKSTNL